MKLVWISLLAVALLPVTNALPGTLLANDAGSGRDAPQSLIPRTPIEPGVLYHAAIAVHDTGDGGYFADLGDSFAFQARAGDTVEMRLRGPQTWYAIEAADGEILDSAGITAAWFEYKALRATAPADGTYYVRVLGTAPQPYCFGIGINEPAPILPYPDGIARCGV